MILQTVKESISKLDSKLNVLDLFEEVKLDDKEVKLKHKVELVLQTANYLSGFMLGEKTSEAFQLPTVGSMIYASDVLKDQDMFGFYSSLEDDFKYVNDGNILNLLELVNNINCYYYSDKKPLCSRLSLSMIDDVKKLAEKIVLFSKEHNIINNIYGFNGGYTNKTNRGHKVSVCTDCLFIIEGLDVDNNSRCLELLSYYILCKRNRDFTNISSIKELIIYDPIKNKELLFKISDLKQELIDYITENIL